MKALSGLRISLLLVSTVGLTTSMQGKLAWNKKSRAYDAGVTGCTSCHVNEKPKKKDEPLSERGQWLVEQKAKNQAKEVNLAWLKDYPNNGK